MGTKKRGNPVRITTGTVERKIYFSRLTDDSGKPVRPFDWLELLAGKASNGDASLIRRDDNGNDVRLWIDTDRLSCKTYPLHLKMTKSRKRGLPRIISDSGVERPLKLAEEEGLGEKIHISIFDDGLIAHEFNFYGPRFELFASYFNLESNPHDVLEMRNYVRKDIFTQLGDHSEAIMIRIKVPSDAIPAIKRVDETLGEGFRALRDVTGAQILEVTARTKPTKKKSLRGLFFPINKIQSLVKAMIAEPDSQLKGRFYNSAKNQRETLNLLIDRLVATRHVTLDGPRERSVNSQSAYDALQSSKDEFSYILQNAVLI